MSSEPADDKDAVMRIITSKPFINVEGLFNLRVVDSLPTSSGYAQVKPSYLYRSGDTSKITPKGKEQLEALGIKKIFDFRADAEVARFKSPAPTFDGIEYVKVPVFQSKSFDTVSIAQVLQNFETDEVSAFNQSYVEILKDGGDAFGAVLRHMRDHPDEPCLVHCSAGKDRTGVFTAVWLNLLGIPDEDIIHDYALTAYGLFPVLPHMEASFRQLEVYQDHLNGAIIMASSSKPETARNLLSTIREEFGGVDSYLKLHCNLTDDDLSRIRSNFLMYKQ